MSPRDTSTGQVLEAMILPALKRGGYSYQTQQRVSDRPGGRRHFVDVIAEKDGKRFLVSLKWQQVSGTAEQKVPFEVISLADAVTKDGFTKPYLVLSGEGRALAFVRLALNLSPWRHRGRLCYQGSCDGPNRDRREGLE